MPRNVSELQSALDDVAGALEDDSLEPFFDLAVVDEKVKALEELVSSAQTAAEEANDEEESDDDEDED